ncbi:MAG: SseB family protein [Myxococcales bacterium]|nr:SseB family protein [Myxococcales bacterium]
MSHAQIATGLLRIVQDGGSHNTLLIQAPRGYVLATGRRGDPALTVQVASGRQLAEGVRVPDEVHQRLYERGFRRGTAADNHGLVLELQGHAAAGALAHEILDWVRAAYDHAGAVAVDFVPGEVDPTENPRVIELMTALSRDRDMKTRRRLWMALVNATWLVPLTRAVDAEAVGLGGALPLRVLGELAGGEVVGAFTDFGHLLGHDPRPRPYVRVHGKVLFPALAARKVASLLLNPGQGVRGELYRHEIETLAEGVQRMAGSH